MYSDRGGGGGGGEDYALHSGIIPTPCGQTGGIMPRLHLRAILGLRENFKM